MTTNNALIHVDQAGKCTGAALNPWANLVSDSMKFEQVSQEPLPLEYSSLMFITSDVALLFLQDGLIRVIKVQRDGRTISKIVLLPDQLDMTAPPSSIELVRSHLSAKAPDGTTQACYAFVGSTLADSQLLKVDFRTILDEKVLRTMQVEEAPLEQSLTAEEDEDDIGQSAALLIHTLLISPVRVADIYGSAEVKEAVLNDTQDFRIAAASRFVVSTDRSFTVPSYGPIRAASMGLTEAEASSGSLSRATDAYISVYRDPANL